MIKRWVIGVSFLFLAFLRGVPYSLDHYEFDNHRVHIVTFDLAKCDLILFNCHEDTLDDPFVGLQTVEEVAKKTHSAIVVNGGFFKTSGAPAGLYYSKSEQLVASSPKLRGAVGWSNSLPLADPKHPLKFGRPMQIEDDWRELDYVIGGAPLLLLDGKIQEFSIEKTLESFLLIPHARSAIGVNQEGKVVLVKADGFRQGYIGFPMAEWASWLKEELGLVDALNLDGGSSSSLFVEELIFTEAHRPVGNVLIVAEKRVDNL